MKFLKEFILQNTIKMLKTIISLAILFVGASGFQTFQGLIPNGNKVSNPCHPEDAWPGVGHKAFGGGGERNAFGHDFHVNNKTWTKALCEKDSDGDGRSNGLELGDPDCTWKPNAIPKRTTNITHPGVCEPIGDHNCMAMNSWLTCPKTFNCPDFAKSTTKILPMVIPRTTVPANETTYICHGFKMPNDTKYHGIGMVPVIDNKEIMHHMLLFGCTKPPTDEMMNQAIPCSMGVDGCQTIIGLWSVGQDGECHPQQYGFPIGNGGYQYTLLQLHWNNPLLTTGMTDASGINFYYTDQLRPNDAMVVMTGQNSLTIPPQLPSITFEGTCKGSCSKYIEPSAVNISAAFLHMHLLGKSGKIEMLRNGQLHKVLQNEITYDYNTPVTAMQDPPIEFKAGDEIKVTCEFQSLKKNKTTHFGEGTQDEMCLGFITIYPAVVGFDFCLQYQDVAACSMPQFDIYGENNCNVNDFNSLLDPIKKYCQYGNCSKVCMVLMQGLKATGCFDGSMWWFIEEFWSQAFPEFQALVPLLKSCSPNETVSTMSSSVSPVTTPAGGNPGCNSLISSAAQVPANLLFIPTLLIAAFTMVTALLH